MQDNYIYLDNAATTAVRSEVLAEMLPYFSNVYGNASSQHKKGREAFVAVDRARGQVASAINAESRNSIYFTSGGTEADAWAVRGAAYARCSIGKHLITSKIEHHAILNNMKQLEKEGFSVTYVGVDADGTVDLKELESAVTPQTTLISIMSANNEIGTIQPISEIGKIAKAHKVLFHTDAVQAVGAIDIDVQSMNIDLLSMSAHKFYGPKGIGALYIRNGVKIDKFQIGGGQERTMRGGTHNTPAIVGMGKAIELAKCEMNESNQRLSAMRDRLIARIESEIPYVFLNGARKNRLPNNVNFSFRYVEGESILMLLDMAGIGVSSGSACSSGSLEQSHVLAAIARDIGISQGTIRFTFGKYNSDTDADYTADKLKGIVERLRLMSPLKADQ